MSRLALYRKWRPMTFRDVVEQRHVVETLRNAMKTDAVGHAYLFCGTRGTGKTTMAKIFARAINCLQPQDGNPCNTCAVCKGILEGSLLDVMEMDAASNNSVDNIRDIRDEVIYAPAVARYKVYIIDEVHMLSSGAFNALLKTLEEPPEHVVFILATTEPQKLPATVLSRCQRFDFKRITEKGIAERLGEIATDCGINVTPEALLFLARLAGGAMRDAISLLDQLTTLGLTDIDVHDVNEMAGFASQTAIRKLAGALLAGDIAASWTVLDELMREGRDLSQLCVQLLSWFRNVLLLQLGGASSPLLDLHPDDMEDARMAVQALDAAELSAWLRELSEHELRLRRTDNPRIMMEVLLLRLCTRAAGSGQPVPAVSQEPVHGNARVENSFAAPDDGAFRGQEARLVRLEHKISEMSAQWDALPARGEPLPAETISGGAMRMPASSSVAEGGSNHGGADHAGTNHRGSGHGASGKSSKPAEKASDIPAFAPWARVIDEIRRLGPSRPGGMKLFAYILDTDCLVLDEGQLRVVVAADDVLKRRVLAQSDSLSMMEEAVRVVTGETWKIRIVDAKEAAALRTKSGAKNSISALQQNVVADETAPMDVPAVSTGDEALDRLMDFSRDTGIPLEIQDDTES